MQKWGREISSRPLFCFLKKLYIRAKQVVSTFDLICFAWRRLNVFLEKGLGIVLPTHFVYDFLRKMFLMLYFINWPDFIVWFLLRLEKLGNVCIESAPLIIKWHSYKKEFFNGNLLFKIVYGNCRPKYQFWINN